MTRQQSSKGILATAVHRLNGFIPKEIFDIHAHLFDASHFQKDAFPLLNVTPQLKCADHQDALARYMPGVQTIHGLYFGLPHRSANRVAINEWISGQVRESATALSKALLLVSPGDDQRSVAIALRSGLYSGIKVYHCYATRADTMNACVEEYAPEWMWELLHEVGGVLMLHIVRHEASADKVNQRDLRALCTRYGRVKVVLAHVARSFNYRHARSGLPSLADLENVYVDTSAVCETEAFRAALRHFGIQRILWGSDFPISEMRGRAVATGDAFFWLHPEVVKDGYAPPEGMKMTLVGVESLLSLQEVCEDEGLNESDIRYLFFDNAIKLLEPSVGAQGEPDRQSGPAVWTHAREVIAGGTGLLSKRAEMFHSGWPSYYARAAGSSVWDLDGRRYTDFAGGIGSVLLGYSDEDVNRAVRRRLVAGTYSSLVSPEEVRLADTLLTLHPWAAKVRYARGGGEGMAVAVRIARASTGCSGVLFCGYHGWHDWYLAANLADDRALDGHLLPGLSPHGVPRELKGTSVPFKYNDFGSFERAFAALNGNLAAVVMEPMRSELPKDDFVARVAARCRASGAVFILDEVTSGLRYGFPGAHSTMNLTPDMVVYAKAISNGFPFAVIIGTDEVMRGGERSFISSSYWTDGVGPAAASAVLEKMRRLDIQPRLWERGVIFQENIRKIAAQYKALQLRIGGMPVSSSLSFGDPKLNSSLMPLFISKMQKEGYLVNSTLYLMHAHSDLDFSGFLDSFERTLSALNRLFVVGELPESGSSGGSTGFARLA